MRNELGKALSPQRSNHDVFFKIKCKVATTTLYQFPYSPIVVPFYFFSLRGMNIILKGNRKGSLEKSLEELSISSENEFFLK